MKKYVKDLTKLIEEWKIERANNVSREFFLMREYYGLTQEQLAEAVGKHYNTICNIETGKTKITDIDLYAYSRAAYFRSKDLGIKPKGGLVADSEDAVHKLFDALRKKDRDG